MRIKVQNALVAALVGVAWLLPSTQAGTTNGIGWWDAFETYTNGMLIDGTNGWSAAAADSAVVTADTNVTLLLTNYPTLTRSYPLPSSTHSNVLQFSTEVRNAVGGGSNGIVKVDFLALPLQMEVPPTGDTNVQCSFCVSTNKRLTIWHFNVPLGTNEWRELISSPTIDTNTWARFTIVSDYSNSLFQVRVNESDPITDSAGWTSATGVLGGAWFHMVQTNRLLSGFKADGVPAYLDDVLVTNRTLTWSGTGFAETNLNNGRIDTNTPFTITLAADTFNGADNTDLIASGGAVATNVPPGLTAVVSRVSATQAVVTCIGTAAQHEKANSISNLAIRFTDAAFGFGSAWDVGGNPRTNLTVTFLDTPRLTWSTNAFREAAANDGSIDNTNPLLITLTNGTFKLSLGVDFGADTSKITFTNVPPGLNVEAILTNATQVRIRFTSSATAHAATNSLSNLGVAFQDGAFVTVPASSVFNVGTNLSIAFTDPSGLTYGTNVFRETVANNGAVSGTMLSLSNKTFDATNGEDLVLDGKVVYTNLPGTLGLQVICGASAQAATLIFTGTANSNALANSVSNLTITFRNSAFIGGNAAGVANYSLSNLRIQFDDPRFLTYSATNFVELAGGVIDNRIPMTITLSGDTLAGTNGEDFVKAGRIAVAGSMPGGLAAQIVRDSATQLSVRLTGRAGANASGNSVNDLSFTFGDGAFSGANAVYVGNAIKSGIGIVFVDDVGFFNTIPYEEPFEAYANGTAMDGTNGWTALVDPAAATVTNDPAVATNVLAYLQNHASFPVGGTHTQELFVQDYIQDAIHSETNRTVYVDFMTWPVPLQDAPESDTNVQCAFYVSTNSQLVIWHNYRVGGYGNEWLALTSAPAIDTSRWMRLTIAQDYTHGMFQVRVNESKPIEDARGWTGGGVSQTGSWYYMVQTNGTLSGFRMSGVGAGYLDDLTVKTALPSAFGWRYGTMFLMQ